MLNAKELHNEITCKYMGEIRFDTKKNSRLYHYTTLSILQCILESNSFHMTDYRYLNDPTEMRYTINILEKILKNFKLKNKITENVLNAFNSCFSLGKVEDKGEYEFSQHILSFSEDYDNLSMWRAYANNAQGITIGIKPPNYNKKTTAKYFYWKNPIKVIYDKKNQEKILKEILNECVTRYKINQLEKIDIEILFFSIIYPFLATGKHYGYKEEKEVRYFYTPWKSSVKTKINGNADLIPYYQTDNVFLEKKNGKKLLPIREIGIGPRLDFEKTKHSSQLQKYFLLILAFLQYIQIFNLS